MINLTKHFLHLYLHLDSISQRMLEAARKGKNYITAEYTLSFQKPNSTNFFEDDGAPPAGTAKAIAPGAAGAAPKVKKAVAPKKATAPVKGSDVAASLRKPGKGWFGRLFG